MLAIFRPFDFVFIPFFCVPCGLFRLFQTPFVISDESTAVLMPPTKLDYSLTGENSTKAIERGLAQADWYQSPVPRPLMRKLLERRDGPAIRDTIIWFGLIIGFGYLTYRLWPSWWAIVPYLIYAVLYASTSDSRWHDPGTAPRSRRTG